MKEIFVPAREDGMISYKSSYGQDLPLPPTLFAATYLPEAKFVGLRAFNNGFKIMEEESRKIPELARNARMDTIIARDMRREGVLFPSREEDYRDLVLVRDVHSDRIGYLFEPQIQRDIDNLTKLGIEFQVLN